MSMLLEDALSLSILLFSTFSMSFAPLSFDAESGTFLLTFLLTQTFLASPGFNFGDTCAWKQSVKDDAESTLSMYFVFFSFVF